MLDSLCVAEQLTCRPTAHRISPLPASTFKFGLCMGQQVDGPSLGLAGRKGRSCWSTQQQKPAYDMPQLGWMVLMGAATGKLGPSPHHTSSCVSDDQVCCLQASLQRGRQATCRTWQQLKERSWVEGSLQLQCSPVLTSPPLPCTKSHLSLGCRAELSANQTVDVAIVLGYALTRYALCPDVPCAARLTVPHLPGRARSQRH